MKHILDLTGIFSLFLLCLMACSEAEAPPPTAIPEAVPTAIAYRGTIVAMGDSLTTGLGLEEIEAYPALLEERLLADGLSYRVINAGVSGETSSGALSRVDWLLTLEPDIILLETGGNDSLRGISLELTEDNINQLVVTFKEKNIPVILAGMQTMQNLGQEYTTAFAEIYPRVAETHDLILIPLFFAGIDPEDPEQVQPDGIHPTAVGQKIILETIYPYVLEAIEVFEGS